MKKAEFEAKKKAAIARHQEAVNKHTRHRQAPTVANMEQYRTRDLELARANVRFLLSCGWSVNEIETLHNPWTLGRAINQ